MSDKIKIGCLDGSCVFGAPKGMHTNGGCNCLPRMPGRMEERNALRKDIKALVAERDQLKLAQLGRLDPAKVTDEFIKLQVERDQLESNNAELKVRLAAGGAACLLLHKIGIDARTERGFVSLRMSAAQWEAFQKTGSTEIKGGPFGCDYPSPEQVNNEEIVSTACLYGDCFLCSEEGSQITRKDGSRVCECNCHKEES